MKDRESSIQIAPSILAADFLRLGEQIREAEAAGAERLHLDIMDGAFVPNISFGIPVVRAVRAATSLPLDVHLMINAPERYVSVFVEAGATTLIVHQENSPHLHRTIQQIRNVGARPGVALNPATPPAVLNEILEDLDYILVMSVNPGFGGQSFIPASLGKIAELREAIDELNPGCELAVDGGIDLESGPDAARSGARVLVAGTSVFRARQGVQSAIQELRRTATEALQRG